MNISETVWNQVLEDILLENLPVPVICLMRCVCKKWNSLICSRASVVNPSKVEERPYLVFPFVKQSSATLATYSPSLSKWYHLPLCNLRPSLPQLHLWKPWGDIDLIAADGGLLCFMIGFTTPEKDVKFIVLNPLANTWRQLPPFPQNRRSKPPSVCGMHVDRSSRFYKLILAGHLLMFGEEGHMRTYLYDSSTQAWKLGGDLPHEVYGVQKQCTFWDGSFHYVECCTNQVRAYDELHKVWKNVLPILPPIFRSPTLVERYGHILIVGTIANSGSLEIMELNKSRTKWRMIENMHLQGAVIECFFHRDGPDPRNTPLICAGQGDLIFVSKSGSNSVMLLDVSQGTWSFLPCRPCSSMNTLDVKATFTFNPTFAAEVWNILFQNMSLLYPSSSYAHLESPDIVVDLEDRPESKIQRMAGLNRKASDLYIEMGRKKNDFYKQLACYPFWMCELCAPGGLCLRPWHHMIPQLWSGRK